MAPYSNLESNGGIIDSKLKIPGSFPVRKEDKPEFLSESGESNFTQKIEDLFNRPKEKEIVTLLRELSILVEARVPLIRALSTMKNQNYTVGVVSLITRVCKKIEEGKSLSEALESFPKEFSPLYINVIRAGEASGRLERVLNYLASYREKQFELKRKIMGALMYPLIISLSFAGVFVFLMIFVMPTLTKTLSESGVKLPWTTKLVMAVSGFFVGYWYLVLFVVVLIALGAFYYTHTEEGKKQWDFIKIKIPISGSLLQYMYMNRFAENLGMLLGESVPITQSLEITGKIMGNYVYYNVLSECVKEVQKGKMISGVLEKSPYFPNVVSQILRVGEESGKTVDTLNKIAEYYGREVDNMTQNMMTLIEPVMILLLGVGTAVIVASVIMPIYNMAGAI